MATKPLLRVLQGETLTPPPVWLMRQAGRYLPDYRKVRAGQPDFIAFCLNPEAAAEVTLQPIQRFELDAAIVFADILLVPYGLGQEVWFEAGEGPKLGPLDVDALDVDGLEASLAPVSETLHRVKTALPEESALIGFAGAPWTVATYMIEGGGSKDRLAARTLAWADPGRMQALIDVLVEATAHYLIAQARAGADVLKLFDSWADGLPPPLFDRLVIAPTRAIVETVRAAGVSAPVIGFPKGAGPSVAAYAAETGVDGLALDHGLETGWATANLPMNLPIQGQLDPAALKAGGLALEAEARRLLAAWAGRPYVFNLGHGVDKDTPPEHVAELIAIIRETAP